MPDTFDKMFVPDYHGRRTSIDPGNENIVLVVPECLRFIWDIRLMLSFRERKKNDNKATCILLHQRHQSIEIVDV